jgi:hypothetical protein
MAAILLDEAPCGTPMSTSSSIHGTKQTYAGEETKSVWMVAIKRLVHRYLNHRKKQRALRRARAENAILGPYEGRRWCDATERELVRPITIGNRSHF